MKKLVEVTMLFDDIRFGIDVRDQRRINGWSQEQLAHKIGYRDGNSISRVETATSTESMTIRRYMTLCNVLSLHPMHYWYSEEDMLEKMIFLEIRINQNQKNLKHVADVQRQLGEKLNKMRQESQGPEGVETELDLQILQTLDLDSYIYGINLLAFK